MTMAILDDVEELSVGFALQSRGIAKVSELELLINGHIAFAIAVVSVAHRAIVTVIFLALSKGFGSGLNRIDLMHSLGRNGERVRRRGFRGSLVFLRCRSEQAKQQRQKNDTRLQQGALPAMTEGSV